MQPCPIKYSSMRSVTFLWVSSANPANDEPFRQRMNQIRPLSTTSSSAPSPSPYTAVANPFGHGGTILKRKLA